jgi:hypothetical protein
MEGLMAIYDRDDLIDGEWHPEAFTAGMEARSMGRAIDGPDNPYRAYGSYHWMLKSFRAGWCDMDQTIQSDSSENSTP